MNAYYLRDLDTFPTMLSEKYHSLLRHLNKRSLRLCAVADTCFLGHGGIVTGAKACNLAHNTIYAGIRDLEGEKQHQFDTTKHYRIRKSDDGSKQLTKNNPQILMALKQMVDPVKKEET